MDSWVDGQPADALSLKDRGLAYGDGLFETIAVHDGFPVLLDRHLVRLAKGAVGWQSIWILLPWFRRC